MQRRLAFIDAKEFSLKICISRSHHSHDLEERYNRWVRGRISEQCKEMV
jgi:hypothetical protein